MNQYPVPCEDPLLTRRAILVAGACLAVVAFDTACGGGDRQSAPHDTDTARSLLDDLSGLEAVAGRKLFHGAMQFFDVPTTAQERRDAMSWEPAALDLLEQAGLQATVIVEPSGIDMGNVDPRLVDSFFKDLQDNGVTSAQLGRVVVCPEYFVGGWQNADPSTYAHDVNLFTKALDDHFPGTKASVMIDLTEADQTFAAIDASDEKIDTSRLESAGVQAFANSTAVQFGPDGRADISPYLSAGKVAAVTTNLGLNKIWLNTGIIKHDARLQTSYTVDQRVSIAHATADVVAELQKRGITVDAVNLFAQKKMNSEGRDFSFTPDDKTVLVVFSQRLNALGVPMSGFTAAAA